MAEQAGRGTTIGSASDGGITPRMQSALLKGSAHLMFLMGPHGEVVDAAPSVTYLLGYEREAIIGSSVIDLLPAEDRESAMGILAQDVIAAQTGSELPPDSEIPGEFRVRHADGHYCWFELLRTNFIADPEINGLLIVGRRIDHRHVLTDAISVLAYDPDGLEAMRQMTDYLNLEMPDARAAIRLGGTDGAEVRWLFADDVVAPLCTEAGPWDGAIKSHERVAVGIEDDALVPSKLARLARDCGFRGCWCMPLPILTPLAYPRFPPSPQQPIELMHPGDAAEEVSRLGCLVVWTRGSIIPSGPYLAVMERVGLFAEIALRRKRDRDQIRKLLNYDNLTGALTRVGMQAVLADDQTPCAHVLIDLDDFKLVNDRYGHGVGDELLRLATQRIAAAVRHHDRIVRLGGDEFLVLLPDDGLKAAIPAVKRLLVAFSEPFQIGPSSVTVGVSVGVTAHDPDVDFETIRDRADRAMYAAKHSGKNQWALWQPNMGEVATGPPSPRDG